MDPLCWNIGFIQLILYSPFISSCFNMFIIYLLIANKFEFFFFKCLQAEYQWKPCNVLESDGHTHLLLRDIAVVIMYSARGLRVDVRCLIQAKIYLFDDGISSELFLSFSFGWWQWSLFTPSNFTKLCCLFWPFF